MAKWVYQWIPSDTESGGHGEWVDTEPPPPKPPTAWDDPTKYLALNRDNAKYSMARSSYFGSQDVTNNTNNFSKDYIDSGYHFKYNGVDSVFVPKEYVEKGYYQDGLQWYNKGYLNKDVWQYLKPAKIDPALVQGTSAEKILGSKYQSGYNGYLVDASIFDKYIKNNETRLDTWYAYVKGTPIANVPIQGISEKNGQLVYAGMLGSPSESGAYTTYGANGTSYNQAWKGSSSGVIPSILSGIGEAISGLPAIAKIGAAIFIPGAAELMAGFNVGQSLGRGDISGALVNALPLVLPSPQGGPPVITVPGMEGAVGFISDKLGVTAVQAGEILKDAVSFAASGGDLKGFLKSQAAQFLGDQAGSFVSQFAGKFDVPNLQKLASSVTAASTKALLTNQNVGAAAKEAFATVGVPMALNSVPGYAAWAKANPNAAKAVQASAITAAKTGDPTAALRAGAEKAFVQVVMPEAQKLLGATGKNLTDAQKRLLEQTITTAIQGKPLDTVLKDFAVSEARRVVDDNVAQTQGWANAEQRDGAQQQYGPKITAPDYNARQQGWEDIAQKNAATKQFGADITPADYPVRKLGWDSYEQQQGAQSQYGPKITAPDFKARQQGWEDLAEKNAAVKKFGADITPAIYAENAGWDSFAQKAQAQSQYGSAIKPDDFKARQKGWEDYESQQAGIKKYGTAITPAEYNAREAGWRSANDRAAALSTFGPNITPTEWSRVASQKSALDAAKLQNENAKNQVSYFQQVMATAAPGSPEYLDAKTKLDAATGVLNSSQTKIDASQKSYDAAVKTMKVPEVTPGTMVITGMKVGKINLPAETAKQIAALPKDQYDAAIKYLNGDTKAIDKYPQLFFTLDKFVQEATRPAFAKMATTSLQSLGYKPTGEEVNQVAEALRLSPRVADQEKYLREYASTNSQKVNVYDASGRQLTVQDLKTMPDTTRFYDAQGKQLDAMSDRVTIMRPDQTKLETTIDAVKDIGLGLAKGVGNVSLSLRQIMSKDPMFGDYFDVMDKINEKIYGKPAEQITKDLVKSIESSYTPETKAAAAKLWWDSDRGTFGAAWTDPRSYMVGLAESMPESLLSMYPALRLAKGTYAAKLAAGATEVEAATAAATAAKLVGGTSEGLLAGAGSSRDVMDNIMAKTPEQLKNSDVMKALMAGGLSFEDAKRQLATDAASQAFAATAITTGIFSGSGDAALAKAFTSGIGKNIIDRAAKGLVAEGFLEEAPQSYLQKISQNAALQKADSTIGILDGALNEALGGVAIGGLQGASMSSLGHSAAQATGVSESKAQDYRYNPETGKLEAVLATKEKPSPFVTNSDRKTYFDVLAQPDQTAAFNALSEDDKVAFKRADSEFRASPQDQQSALYSAYQQGVFAPTKPGTPTPPPAPTGTTTPLPGAITPAPTGTGQAAVTGITAGTVAGTPPAPTPTSAPVPAPTPTGAPVPAPTPATPPAGFTQAQIDIAVAQAALQSGAQVNALKGDFTTALNAAIESGKQGDAALQAAIAQVKTQTETSQAALQKQIADNQAEFQKQFDAARAEGKTSDTALQKAIEAVGTKTGQSVADLKTQFDAALKDAQAKGASSDAALKAAIDAASTTAAKGQAATEAKLAQTDQRLTDFAKQTGQNFTDIKKQFDSAFKDAQTKGASSDAALQAAIDKVGATAAANQKATTEQISNLGASVSKISAGQAGLEQKYGTLQNNLQTFASQTGQNFTDLQKKFDAAFQAAQAKGESADSALQSAINKVAVDAATSQKITSDQITKLGADVGTVRSAVAQLGAQTQAQFGDVNTRIAELQRQGMSQADATNKAIQELASGQTQLGQQIAAGQQTTQAQFGDVNTRINELQRQGLSQAEATSKALQELAGGQLQTQAQIQAQQQQTQAQFGDVNARIAELQRQGMSQAEATSKAIEELAGGQTQLGQQIAAGQQQTKAQFGDVNARITELQQQGLSQTEATNKALQELAGGQLKTQQELAAAQEKTQQQFGTLEQKFNARVDELMAQGVSYQTANNQAMKELQQSQIASQQQTQTQIEGVKSQFNNRVDELMAQGRTYQDATNLALNELRGGQETLSQQQQEAQRQTAEQLARQQEQTQTQIGNVQTQFDQRVNQLMQQGQTYQAATNLALQELAAGQTQLGETIGGVKTGLEQQITGLQTGLTGALTGIGQQLTAQQQAAAQQQQRGKFESLLQQFMPAAAAAGAIPAVQAAPLTLETKAREGEFAGPLTQFFKQVGKGDYARPTSFYQPETPQQRPEQDMAGYFNYGQQSEIDDILGERQYAKGGMVAPLMAAKGGLGVVHHSGKKRLDFRQGAHVAGPGDGQSDDIPAMLADGEYVLDAEIVSALGNGSTKAGAELLDKFREQIRKHKRGGGLHTIPPKSKSPLEYLAAASKGARKK